MIGALIGLSGIPNFMVHNLLSFDCENIITAKGIERPDFLNLSKHVLPNILKLIQVRPKKELIIDDEFPNLE